MHKDTIGREIRPGDFVTYAKGVEMNIGIVTKLNPVMVSVNRYMTCRPGDLMVVNEQLRYQGKDGLMKKLTGEYGKDIDTTPPKQASTAKKYKYAIGIVEAADGSAWVVAKKLEATGTQAVYMDNAIKADGFVRKKFKHDYSFSAWVVRNRRSDKIKLEFRTSNSLHGKLLLRDMKDYGMEYLLDNPVPLDDFRAKHPDMFDDVKHYM